MTLSAKSHDAMKPSLLVDEHRMSVERSVHKLKVVSLPVRVNRLHRIGVVVLNTTQKASEVVAAPSA